MTEKTEAMFVTGYGGYQNLALRQVDAPGAPKDDEVVVDVRAVGLNFAEIMMRQGLYDLAPKPPFVPGYEGAGVVKAVGASVTAVAVGDRVVYLMAFGGWQRTLAVPMDTVWKLPDNLSFEQGAALPVNYVTAYHCLHDLGGLRKGHRVVCHAAAGGVGTAVGQLARLVDDVTVIGTASQGKHDFCKQNGYSHLISDYRNGAAWDAAVRAECPEGVDLVLDSLGGCDTEKAVSLCRPLGRVVCFGISKALTGSTVSYLKLAYRVVWQGYKFSARDLMPKNVGVLGYHAGYLAREASTRARVAEAMVELLKLAEKGSIEPFVGKTFPFEDMAKAQEYMTEGKSKGKIVLLMTPPAATEEDTPKD
ncbi:Narbonolide/10-deoxymethynolide synthase PikA2 [Diplonema papillatum]|nr:Narbonolide/10-deoxymethynolide synthase PikA2 [Diplonema papillatum]